MLIRLNFNTLTGKSVIFLNNSSSAFGSDPMLLAIDVGNSHTVSGLFQGEKLLRHWRLKTDRRKTADELATTFHTLFLMNGISFQDISAVIIASVVPTQQRSWEEFIKNVGWQYLKVTAGSDNGMKILTDNPREVGADRIVNAIAAYESYPSALIVVDFGTAITFDCVSAKREYLGGAIVPGIAISIDALSERTAKLPRVDISEPPASIIGRTTVDAIKSGILFGYGCLVDGMIGKISTQFAPHSPVVVATGGMAEVIAPYAETIENIDPLLTLKGLRLIYERNRVQ